MRRVSKSKKTKKGAQRRRGAPAGLDRIWLLRGGLALCALLVLGGGGWLWTSGWVERQAEAVVEQFHKGAVSAGLAVGQVLVEGRVRSEKDVLLAAIGVERGMSILAIDLDAAQAKLTALPWIAEAEVERQLPDIVYLRLVERQPVALWQLEGRLAVIDREGVVIPDIPAKSFAALPLVVGPGAAQEASALLGILAREPDLEKKVTASVRVGERRWNLQMEGGIDVRLPEQGEAEAWSHFARMERKHGLLKRDVVAIDLRLPDRLVVRVGGEKGTRDLVVGDGKNT
ncbi:MAG: cell division protein FtsQ/DivIB [Pseudomonadota bacterium]